MTRAEVLEAALKAVDGDEYALARRLGIPFRAAPKQFERWRRNTGMNFEMTMACLEIAGLLKEKPR